MTPHKGQGLEGVLVEGGGYESGVGLTLHKGPDLRGELKVYADEGDEAGLFCFNTRQQSHSISENINFTFTKDVKKIVKIS